MNKKSKKVKKEWIEITICEMLDEIQECSGDEDKIMAIIKKYSAEIYNARNYDKK